jgi:NADPH:quinone reductase-like Zn-dependent oxidoreductase
LPESAVYTRYGPAEAIQIQDVEKPAPKEHEVLVKVRAASVNPLAKGVMRGGGRLVSGLRKPNLRDG